MTTWTVDRLRDEIVRLGARGLPREEYFAELVPRLCKVIGNDATCWHTLDPHTHLLTSDASADLVERGIFSTDSVQAAGEAIIRSEYVVDDVNTFAGLARRRVPVGIHEHATRGKPEQSARYRDVLGPADIPHELRAAFLLRGRVWGAVHIARRASSGAFEQADAEKLALLTGAIAEGIRTSMRFDAARRVTGADAPGLILLGPDNGVELITPPARGLLDALNSGPGEVPAALLALASFLRSGRGDPASGAVVTAPSAAGWLTLHASLPGADGRVAVVIERATGMQSAALRLEAHGATAREREVATMLARGLTNAEIADALVLSQHTVSDHVKNLFEKVGVSTRQELVARVFLDEYLPEVVRATPLTSRGRFDVA